MQLKIEIPANRSALSLAHNTLGQDKLTIRYDLLCIEGLARALRIFLQKDQPPTYTLSAPAQLQEVYVEASVCCLIGVRCEPVLIRVDLTSSTLFRIGRPPTRSTYERARIRQFHRLAR